MKAAYNMYNNRNLRMCDSSPKRLESTVLHFLNAKPVQQWKQQRWTSASSPFTQYLWTCPSSIVLLLNLAPLSSP